MRDKKEQRHSRAGGLSEWKEQTGQRAQRTSKDRNNDRKRDTDTCNAGLSPSAFQRLCGRKGFVILTGSATSAGEEE
jgi:hypothetical protein